MSNTINNQPHFGLGAKQHATGLHASIATLNGNSNAAKWLTQHTNYAENTATNLDSTERAYHFNRIEDPGRQKNTFNWQARGATERARRAFLGPKLKNGKRSTAQLAKQQKNTINNYRAFIKLQAASPKPEGQNLIGYLARRLNDTEQAIKIALTTRQPAKIKKATGWLARLNHYIYDMLTGGHNSYYYTYKLATGKRHLHEFFERIPVTVADLNKSKAYQAGLARGQTLASSGTNYWTRAQNLSLEGYKQWGNIIRIETALAEKLKQKKINAKQYLTQLQEKLTPLLHRQLGVGASVFKHWVKLLA